MNLKKEIKILIINAKTHPGYYMAHNNGQNGIVKLTHSSRYLFRIDDFHSSFVALHFGVAS